jgi:hypothetical protein
MLEAEKSFRRLKAHKQLPILRAALLLQRWVEPPLDQFAIQLPRKRSLPS